MTQHRVDDETVPEDIARDLNKAVRLEWVTIAVLVAIVAMVYLVLGNSQAMKTAWIEDMLSFIPPIAFLIGVRISGKPPSAERPFGHHRAIGISHVVASTALTVMGGYLIADSTIKLISAEHPTIGGITLFGVTMWLGWLMIAAMAITAIPPVILGRMKLKLATPLHNKVLYADADMNKADWMTSVAVIVGVTGIGLGWWWSDAVAAIVVATSISRDGITNLHAAVAALMDARPTTVDSRHPHPLPAEMDSYLNGLDWVASAVTRVQDEGQVFHVEGFLVPATATSATPERLAAARDHLLAWDWKVRDVTLAPVNTLPSILTTHTT